MENTVVGLFDRFDDAQEAVMDLVENGLSRENISLIANDTDASLANEHLKGAEENPAAETGSMASMGAMMGGLAGVLLGLGALAIPGIGPVLAAGPVIAALGGAGVGAVTGGILGALMYSGISESDANAYAEGVRRGGSLVTVNTTDDFADLAAVILEKHNPVNIKQRVNEWTEWKSFEEQAEPYQNDAYKPTEGQRLQGAAFEAEEDQQPRRAVIYPVERKK